MQFLKGCHGMGSHKQSTWDLPPWVYKYKLWFLLEHTHGKAIIINDTTVAKQPSKSTNKLTSNQVEVKLG